MFNTKVRESVAKRLWRRALQVVASILCATSTALAGSLGGLNSPTNIFAPDSTPARSIYRLSVFVLEITGVIFVVVFSLLLYAAIKFRQGKQDEDTGFEPPQIYGSNQIELAWTVVPVIIILVLFVSAAQVIHRVQDARRPKRTIEVTAIGHQYWWEYRYTQFGFVTSNELHVPASDPQNPTPTYIGLQSADVDHSFWVPRLAGKTDLIPNHPNSMWIDPQNPGIYLGQCAQFCGIQHAKMLLRVYVDRPTDFDRWVHEQQQAGVSDPSVAAGSGLFTDKGCFVCHTIQGTAAQGQIGPDLTHLMSRDTLGAGPVPNTRENLRRWIRDPGVFKPGTLMPAQNLTDQEVDQITDYLRTLR